MTTKAVVQVLLHAAPAASAAARAARHRGAVTLEAPDGRRADAANPLALLAVASPSPTPYVIRASGPDAAAVVADLVRILTR